MSVFRFTAIVLLILSLSPTAGAAECTQPSNSEFKGYFRETDIVIGRSVEGMDRPALLQAVESREISTAFNAVRQLTRMPSDAETLAVLRKVAGKETPGDFDYLLILKAIRALATLKDCSWVELARWQLSNLDKPVHSQGRLGYREDIRTSLAYDLGTAGHIEGWPLLKALLIRAAKDGQSLEWRLSMALEVEQKIPSIKPEIDEILKDLPPERKAKADAAVKSFRFPAQ